MSNSPISIPNELAWLYRGVSEIFPNQPDSQDVSENLAQRLRQTDRPLRVKLGIDPTGADIHLGHSIPVRKLRAFQDAGHTAVLIIGDFTARIGDPTGKSEVRKQLSTDEVKQNAQTYLDQVRPILDFDTPGRLEIRYNSEWLESQDLAKIVELLATMTVGQMLAKEGFAERYEQGNPIYLHEFLYPLMQGYDSVAVKADVELGGTDQKFNIAVGRDLQRHFGQTPQFGLLTPILIGTDGEQKMSKSLGNYVGLREDALSMYSKLEKIPDRLIEQYFELLTNVPLDELPQEPRERQKLLARNIVSQYHGEPEAKAAQQAAEDITKRGFTATGEAVPEFSLANVQFPAKLFYILKESGLCKTSGEGQRLIKDGGVKLDGDRISDVNLTFDSPDGLNGKVLQVGKKKFVRLVQPTEKPVIRLSEKPVIRSITQEEKQIRAYYIWEKTRNPDQSANYYEAERQLQAELSDKPVIRSITQEEKQIRAYYIWEKTRNPDQLANYNEAERQLQAERELEVTTLGL